MEEKLKLMRLIEQERKQLNEAVEFGLDREEVFEKSRKLDKMIAEYYKE